MRGIIFLAGTLFLMIGCAHVAMEAPKEPIKLDVSMRLDVYQHVQNDINQIENRINAPSDNPSKISDKHSLLDYFTENAYAQDLSPEAEAAVARRQSRHSDLLSWERKGVVGENKSGLAEIRGPKDAVVQALVESENNDRTIIYRAIADKNGTPIDAVQGLYAKRLQSDAPAGTPVEGDLGWSVK